MLCTDEDWFEDWIVGIAWVCWNYWTLLPNILLWILSELISFVSLSSLYHCCVLWSVLLVQRKFYQKEALCHFEWRSDELIWLRCSSILSTKWRRVCGTPCPTCHMEGPPLGGWFDQSWSRNSSERCWNFLREFHIADHDLHSLRKSESSRRVRDEKGEGYCTNTTSFNTIFSVLRQHVRSLEQLLGCPFAFPLAFPILN